MKELQARPKLSVRPKMKGLEARPKLSVRPNIKPNIRPDIKPIFLSKKVMCLSIS